jgi:hypothetical protein
MPYDHIVAQIDAYMERLVAARLLLTTLDTSMRKVKVSALISSVRSEMRKAPAPALRSRELEASLSRKTKAAVSKKPGAKARSSAQLEIFATPAASEPAMIPDKLIGRESAQPAEKILPAAAPTVRRRKIRALQPLQKRPVANKSVVAGPATALGGLVPTGPVFIPAKQIRNEESLRQQKAVAERDQSGSSASAPLTAELLAQRWIQS